MKLWEAKHPYYMNEGNYYAAGCHTEWESLDLFLEDFGDANINMNRIHRWDWHEGQDHDLGEYNGSDTDRIGRLMIFMVLQRKAALISHEIKVCRNDEPAARNYLQKHANLNAQIWSPIAPDAFTEDE